MANRRKTSLSVDIDLMKEVGKRCIDLGLDKSEALDIALREWLALPAAPRQAPTEQQGANDLSYRASNIPWHDKLETILVKGSERDVVGIQANLDWGETAVIQTTPPAKKKSSGR